MREGYDSALANEWMAWVEDSAVKGTRKQEIYPHIRRWLNEFKPTTLVDIGCGQGSCSELITIRTKYVGVDPSITLIERAKSLYLAPNKKFVIGTAYNTTLGKNSVDAALSVWVWSHLKNLALAAKEMHRILRPGGRFLVITANPETYDERKTFYKEYTVKGNLLTGTFDLGDGRFLTNTTLYLYSKKEIEGAIKHAGFKINCTKRLGKAESSDKGLYLVIEGFK